MPDVIVVGAGISGLSAAWRLQQAGVDVTVLERSSRPGGRMHSVELNGCVWEAGANFVTDAYRIVPGLASEARIGLQPVRNDSAIALAGRLHAFRADRPWTTVAAGLLTARAALSQVPGLARFAAQSRGRGTLDPLDWMDLDDSPTSTWARRLGLTAIAERSWRPAFHGFYFQEALVTSAAAVAAMATHGFRQQTLTMPGGLSTLTDALAAELDVRTSVTVTEVEEDPTGVTVRTDEGSLRAEAVIVAAPGPDLPGLMTLNALESTIAQTPYSAGLLVGLGVGRHLRPHELAGAYGILMHPDDTPLAALCVASRAGHAHSSGDVVTCMFADQPARELTGKSDPEVIDTARGALLAWAPELRGALLACPEANRVVRIPTPCRPADPEGSPRSAPTANTPKPGASSSPATQSPGPGQTPQPSPGNGQPIWLSDEFDLPNDPSSHETYRSAAKQHEPPFRGGHRGRARGHPSGTADSGLRCARVRQGHPGASATMVAGSAGDTRPDRGASGLRHPATEVTRPRPATWGPQPAPSPSAWSENPASSAATRLTERVWRSRLPSTSRTRTGVGRLPTHASVQPIASRGAVP